MVHYSVLAKYIVRTLAVIDRNFSSCLIESVFCQISKFTHHLMNANCLSLCIKNILQVIASIVKHNGLKKENHCREFFFYFVTMTKVMNFFILFTAWAISSKLFILTNDLYKSLHLQIIGHGNRDHETSTNRGHSCQSQT